VKRAKYSMQRDAGGTRALTQHDVEVSSSRGVSRYLSPFSLWEKGWG